MVLGFNALAAALTAAAVYAVHRRPDASPALPIAAVGTVLAVVALVLPDDVFLVFKMAAWAACLWLPAGLLGAAVVLRAHQPRLGAAFAALGTVDLLVSAWAFFVEPTWLEITTIEITSDEIAAPFTIAVVSDFQTDRIGRYEARVMALVAEAEPELILWPGDYVQGDDTVHAEIDPKFNALVRAADLDAPLGNYAVMGNIDHGGPDWVRLFDHTGVVATRETRSYDNGVFRVTALSFADSFDTDLVIPDHDGFHIVFGHGPDFARGDVQADLLVAGHTHGGQVRLPFLGPPITFSTVPRAWAAGRTDLPGGRTLVVSRGIGMERDNAPRLRLFCRPELVFIHVSPR